MAQFQFYPCKKTGKLLKGFCLCEGSGIDMLRTIADWKKYAQQFGIKYYAFRKGNTGYFNICELFPKNQNA